MEALVLSHLTALRALRRARRVNAAHLPSHLGRSEQRRVLLDALPSRASLDLDELARIGALDDGPCSPIDCLIGASIHRRRLPGIRCHALSRPLPSGALVDLGHDLYTTGPAFTALLCSAGRNAGEVLPLLMELLGTYSLPEAATHPIAHGGIWRDPGESSLVDAGHSRDIGPEQGGDSPVDLSVDQAHYRCEPAVTLRELGNVATWGKSSEYRGFSQAVRLAAPGAASPCESIMYGMFGAPMGYGGFGVCCLPGGILLNETIRYDERARDASGGIPYAIADAFIPGARLVLEYNGAYHEQESSQLHDNRRNNGLKAMGIDVIVLDRAQMRNLSALEAVAAAIYKRAGMRFRYRINGYRSRQLDFLNSMRRASGLRAI